ncbi:MAG: flavin reductase [Bacteroidia bacterium]|jgi:flavin reductase (DIM6/NTAB) family NADH-FMN oxidoreductase RutF|nr:flavin reductase [Bacteroidia bacterium]
MTDKKIISSIDILGMEKQMRTNLINSLPGIRQANLIATINKEGITNVAIFNSVVHIGAHPPYMGFIMRPVTVPRGTYKNIKETGFFTINHASENIFKQAHQTSARYDISEFTATGLTPEYISDFQAPFVAESDVQIGLKFVEEYHIKCNDTILMIGEIQLVRLDTSLLNESNILQLHQAESIGVGGLETYYSLSKLAELPYAKP